MRTSLGASLRLLLGLVAVLGACFGGVADARADEGRVIGVGREQEILALVHPYAMGAEIEPGWKLGNVEIQARLIRFHVESSAGGRGALRLEDPQRSPAEVQSASFAIHREGEASALDALSAAVRRNDKGGFWGTVMAPRPELERTEDHWPIERFWRDGLLVLLAAIGVLAVFVRLSLRDVPRSIAVGLLGVTLFGAGVRLVLPIQAPMAAYPYERLFPLARLIYEGPVLGVVNRELGGTLPLVSVITATNLVLASLTPPALFAHARLVLRNDRAAVVAAALIAILPTHIRFSASDVAYIQSLCTSSLTFVALYTALTAKSWRYSVFAFAVLPALCLATYYSRRENMAFFPLDCAAVVIVRRESNRARIALALGLLSLSAAFAFRFHILPNYMGEVRQALDPSILANAWTTLTTWRLNTLINPFITPPGLILLAAAGAVVLFRSGQRERTIFLLAWLALFFVVHSFVMAPEPLMQARYHLHLVTPTILLAAAATPQLLELRSWQSGGIAAYFALSPVLYAGTIRDVKFTEIEEFAFLRDRVVPAIGAHCTVLEYRGSVNERGGRQESSRVLRLGRRLSGGGDGLPFTLVDVAELHAEHDGAREQPTSALERVLENPPTCLFFYDGLSCATRGTMDGQRAPLCRLVEQRLALAPVAGRRVAVRPYDPIMTGQLHQEPDGSTRVIPVLDPGDEVELRLLRAGRVATAAP